MVASALVSAFPAKGILVFIMSTQVCFPRKGIHGNPRWLSIWEGHTSVFTSVLMESVFTVMSVVRVVSACYLPMTPPESRGKSRANGEQVICGVFMDWGG